MLSHNGRHENAVPETDVEGSRPALEAGPSDGIPLTDRDFAPVVTSRNGSSQYPHPVDGADEKTKSLRKETELPPGEEFLDCMSLVLEESNRAIELLHQLRVC